MTAPTPPAYGEQAWKDNDATKTLSALRMAHIEKGVASEEAFTLAVEEYLEATAKADYSQLYAARPGLVAPRGLRRWRAALSDSINGYRQVLCLGDSITCGVGSDGSATAQQPVTGFFGSANYDAWAWPTTLRTLLQGKYGSPGLGYIPCFDYRWTVGGSAALVSPYGSFQRGLQVPAAVTNFGQITIPTGQTEADVWFYDGGGKIGVSINGGAATVYTPGNTETATFRTLTGLTPGQTIQVQGVAASTSGRLFGITFRSVEKAKATGVMVSRVGYPGADTGFATGLSKSYVNGVAREALTEAEVKKLMIATFCTTPDLLIVALGVNDAGQQEHNGITPAVYEANLQRLITEQTVTRSGCVLLLSGPFLSTTVGVTEPQSTYFAKATALAQANDHVAALNITDVWGSYEHANGLGLQLAASVHPTRLGHADQGRMLSRVIEMSYGDLDPTS